MSRITEANLEAVSAYGKAIKRIGAQIACIEYVYQFGIDRSKLRPGKWSLGPTTASQKRREIQGYLESSKFESGDFI